MRALFWCAAAFALVGTSAPAQDTELRVVSYNIRHGRGMDDTVDLDRTAAALRALTPDIVGLQEVDRGVRRSGSVDEAAILGSALGMHHAFGAFMEYQEGHYGMGILSRFPITRTTPVRLPEGNEPRIALAAELLLPDSSTLVVVNVHFDWVADDAFRFAQASALTRFLDSLTVPYVLLGDFNDQPGSRTLALFRQRTVEVPKPADDHFTFPSTAPEKEIDFIFLAPAARWRWGRATPVTEPLASDHRPVVAAVTLLSASRPPARPRSPGSTPAAGPR